MYTNGRGQFMQVYVKKYVAWLHVLITLCTSQGSHVHTLFLWWYFKQNWKINAITRISANFKLLQVPLAFSKYRSLVYILMNRYLLFKFALPFSLARTYKRLVQPYRCFPRLCRYSETFLRTFSTPAHIQSLPRSRDAASIDENWTLTERRVRHLERTIPGRYLLSYHTVKVTKHRLVLLCSNTSQHVSF